MSIGAKPWEGAGGAASVPDASETVKGKIRIATSTEASDGTDDLTAMTPAKVKARIDAALVGGVEYKGDYTGQSLVTAKQGDMYISNGDQTLAGVSLTNNDHIIFNQDAADPVTASMFDKIDNTDQVTSVNGQTGPVSLGIGDLNNVTISSGSLLVGGDFVRYDSGDGRWENFTAASINLSDFNNDLSLSGNQITDVSSQTGSTFTATANVIYVVGYTTGTQTITFPDASASTDGDLIGLTSTGTTDYSLDLVSSDGSTNDLMNMSNQDKGGTLGALSLTVKQELILFACDGTKWRQLSRELADVAKTGAYSDLSGTPTLATVATTGAYSDLSGTPTLGTAAAADTGDFLASTAGLDDLSDVAYTAGAGIDNYVLTYDHSTTSWGAEAVPSAASASETVAGVIEIATNAEAAAGTATDKALVPSNISSVDLSQADNTTSGFISGITGENLNDLSDVSFTAGAGIDNYVLTYDNSTTSWGAEAVPSASAASETVAGVIEIATNAEAAAGTATDKALVPSNISSVDLSQADNTTSGFISGITGESLNDLSDVSYTAGAGIDNYVLTYDHSTTSWGAEAAASGGLSAVVDDTTPQLGGALDVNGNAITSASNGNVTINPDGTGDISVGADIIPDADATHTIGDEANRFISLYSDVNGAIRFKAKNDQGAAISKGQVVYIKGVSGTVPTVGLARANSSSTMPAFGLALDNANDQAEVQIITFGNLTDYNTTTYSLSANDTVFVSAATAGALTNSAPTGEANLIQNIGRVVRADASAGIIKVGGAGRSNATPNLDQDKIFLGNASNQAVSTALSAINLTSFNNDLASASETVAGVIEIATNAEAAAGTATDKALVPSNISSVDLSQADNTTSGFISGITGESLNDLSDVSYTAGAGIDNYVLTYDHSTTSWGAEAATGGGLSAVVDDTSPQLGGDLDVNANEITSASNGNVVIRPNGTGHVFLGGNTNPAEVRLYCESSDAHYVGFKSAAHADYGTSVVWELPAGDGNPNQILETDGSGVLSWVDQAGAGGAPPLTTASPSSTYAITDTSSVYQIYLLTPSADVDVTLPSAASAGSGARYDVKNLSNQYTLTLKGQSGGGGDSIDGVPPSTGIILGTQYESLTVVSDGSDWFII